MASESRRFHRLWLAFLAAVAIVQGSVTTVMMIKKCGLFTNDRPQAIV